MTIEKLEEMAKAGGRELHFQDLDELAQVVIEGVRSERFIMMIGVESIGDTMRERAAAFETGSLPERPCRPARLTRALPRRRLGSSRTTSETPGSRRTRSILIDNSKTASGGTVMDRYVVISADGHAGPPSAVYRDYLDPEFRERFDEHQRMMVELREAMGR